MTKSRGVADWGHYPPVNNNILINPSFTVKQRGAVIDHNEESYGPDRWFIRGVNGTKGTMSQSTTDSSTGVNKLVVNHRNATESAYVKQRIETVNLLGLYGKELTFSFSYSDNGGTKVPEVRVISYDSSDTVKSLLGASNTITSLGNNRWSCTFTLTTDDGTIPALVEKGLQVAIYPNSDSSNNALAAPGGWSVWETKLEVGSVVTPFIARSHGDELALCQRYYEVDNPATPTSFGGAMVGQAYHPENGSGNPMNRDGPFQPYKVNKRASATITTYTYYGVSGAVSPVPTGTADTNINVRTTTSGFQVSSSTYRKFHVWFGWTAEAEL